MEDDEEYICICVINMCTCICMQRAAILSEILVKEIEFSNTNPRSSKPCPNLFINSNLESIFVREEVELQNI